MINPNSLRSLEALRGALALYVVLHHARWLLWEQQAQWAQSAHPWWSNAIAVASSVLRYGHEAVIVFFVLSGFFIHFRWARDAARGEDRPLVVSEYARRRAHRLIPPYAVALAATVLLDSIGRYAFPALYGAHTGDDFLDRAFLRMQFTPESVVSGLLLVPSSTGTHFGTNSPLWSLAYEFVYYAAYPLWLYMRRRIGWSAYLVGSGLALVAAATVPNAFLRNVFLMYPLWLAGASLAEFVLGRSTRFHGAIGPLVIAAAGLAGKHLVPGECLLIPYLMLGVGVGLATINAFKTVVDSRPHKAFEWLGLRSYTIYISHFPLIALISAVTFELAGGRPASGWLALAGAIAALLWANALWWLGEKRFLHPPLRA